jgi:hypothetical protein
MSKVLLFILLTLILISGFLFITTYGKIKIEERNFFVEANEESTINVSNQLSMFVPNMRFDTNSISYSFVDCNRESVDRMKQAFQIVSDETKDIIFYESNIPKIIIYCSEQKGEKRESSYVAGEGGPDKVILLDLYPLIVNGKIYLYQQEKKDNCDYPIVELHELMHVFGFDHINKTNEILYPYVRCEQRITEDIISELKRLYAEKPKADITLQNLTATTHGIYLDFNITILNRGLINAENVSLFITSPDKTIYSTPIGELPPGISQIITAKNILTRSISLNQIKFKTTTNTKEYFYENNEAIATSN